MERGGHVAIAVWHVRLDSSPARQMYVHRVTHLEHVQQRRLAGVIETEEQQLGVLVQQAQAGEHIPDCQSRHMSAKVLPLPR